jgi:hypothetical protein
MWWRWATISGVMCVSLGVRAAQASDSAGVEWFETKVRPVLAERCYSCHSADAKKLKGDLRLDTVDGIKKGGVSEMPAVVAGKPDDSLLLSAVKWDLDDLRMPPKEKLPPDQIAAIETWVKMGAPMPESKTPTTQPGVVAKKSEKMTLDEGRSFWSFVRPTEPKLPDGQGGHNEIDRFVLAKLAEKGLKPAPEADRRTLIRRAAYDLTGLPPSAEEVDAFLSDPAPDAYGKLIDRLLASPRYGERWGRHWLDVARYADTKGYVFEEERRYAFSYTYRDWVIRSFNEDLPYDQFLIHQIAADRLDLKDDKRPLAALGFLTLGRRFINNPHDIIDDRIDVVTRGTMGLTVSCARCHDHKYDPIPTADYYSLYGVFASSVEPKELPVLGVTEKTPAAEEYERERTRLTAERDAWLKGKHEELSKRMRSAESVRRYLIAGQRNLAAEAEQPFPTVDYEKSLNRFTVTRWHKYLKDAAGRNDPVFALWRALVTIPAAEFPTRAGPAIQQASSAGGVNPIVLCEIAGGAAPASVEDLATRYAELLTSYDREEPFANDPAAEELRRVLRDDESPATIKLETVNKRFNNEDNAKLRQLQNAVEALAVSHPGSPPRAMAMEDAPQPVTPTIFKRGNPGSPGEQVPRRFLAILSGENREPFKDGSGRLDLARAIASRENPLTARVMVNRVWQWHFGQGIVRTPSDFGTRGDLPTHPELLDYLAVRFAGEDGWSVKKLHKRIMLSATYRQAAYGGDANAPAVDPENRLLWRFNPQRLDFESLRDSMLAAAGSLDLTGGGRPVDILAQPFSPRRTVYAFVDRQNLPGLFRTFDFASPDGHVAARPMTSVPQQALFMLNSPFVLEQAKKLANQSSIAGETDVRRKVTSLYRAALGRAPTPEEVELGAKFVAAEEAQKVEAPAVAKSPWEYGFGQYDEATGRMKTFTRLPQFVPASGWQGGPTLPDPAHGWALLTAGGGHAGNDAAHSVVRRWTATRDCTVSVAGTLEHNPTEGDGVRARLVTSRDGTLATWVVHHRTAETAMTAITLKQGDTLDFVVDCGAAGSFSFDQFGWEVKVTKVPTPGAVAGDDAGQSWDSFKEFAGPSPKPPTPLTAWERYAQVLLQSNEFMFVD